MGRELRSIGGSIIEALLLWAINEHQQPEVQRAVASLQASRQLSSRLDSNPNNWTLEIYKKVAIELGLILGNTIKLIELTQDFRNLIHPGKAIRTGTACNRSTGRTALAAIDSLVKALTP
jgi:hypothetical protein